MLYCVPLAEVKIRKGKGVAMRELLIDFMVLQRFLLLRYVMIVLLLLRPQILNRGKHMGFTCFPKYDSWQSK